MDGRCIALGAGASEGNEIKLGNKKFLGHHVLIPKLVRCSHAGTRRFQCVCVGIMHTVFTAKGEALLSLLALPLAVASRRPLLCGGGVSHLARGQVGEGRRGVGGSQAEGAVLAVDLGLEQGGGHCCACA